MAPLSDTNRKGCRKNAQPPGGKCGWGLCTPGWLQRCSSMRCFLVLLMAYSFLQGLQGSYTISVLTTLEKRFNMPSSQSGVLTTACTIGYSVCSIFVAHFLKDSHFPRVLAISALMAGLGALLSTIPHFLYGTGKSDLDILEKEYTNITASSHEVLSHFCDNVKGAQLENVSKTVDSSYMAEESTGVAFALFVIAHIIYGMSGSVLWTLGVAFLDTYTSRQISAKIMGKSAGALCSFFHGKSSINANACIHLSSQPAISMQHSLTRSLIARWINLRFRALCMHLLIH